MLLLAVQLEFSARECQAYRPRPREDTLETETGRPATQYKPPRHFFGGGCVSVCLSVCLSECARAPGRGVGWAGEEYCQLQGLCVEFATQAPEI